jgi:hypothetical protein
MTPENLDIVVPELSCPIFHVNRNQLAQDNSRTPIYTSLESTSSLR